MAYALSKFQDNLFTLGISTSRGILDTSRALIDTAERLDQTRHQIMFAALDNVRLNSEHAVQSSRDILDAETVPAAVKIGRKAVVNSVSRNIMHARDLVFTTYNGGRASLLPGKKYIQKIVN